MCVCACVCLHNTRINSSKTVEDLVKRYTFVNKKVKRLTLVNLLSNNLYPMFDGDPFKIN